MDVELTPSGPPETILPEPEAEVLGALDRAADDREALARVVAVRPSSLEAWAALGEATERSALDVVGNVEAYACFRVGYHRGLDLLRKNGWKGSGFVRWEHPSNHGFLRCLDGLRRMAAVIGEDDEAEQCAEFLQMLDPRRPTG